MEAKGIPDEIWALYGFDKQHLEVAAFGNGLINHTWKITHGKEWYILQTINQVVFPDPFAIASNIDAVAHHLMVHHPDYLFVKPIRTQNGDAMVLLDGAYYRIFPFVQGSHAKTVLETADQAFEAARQFGLFTKNLAEFDASQLNITLTGFHDLNLRDHQFLQALEYGNQERKQLSKELIAELLRYQPITEQYRQIIANANFHLRPTHHDTKISNVLFNQKDKAICVIDLDTLMPGFFISDLGDMMRTYLCPVSEEETNLEKIHIRKDFYQAVIDGYCSEMGQELTSEEIAAIPYAGQFMIYMQALRFLTDYLNNDQYYGASYTEQNLNRAKNQLVLLERLSACL